MYKIKNVPPKTFSKIEIKNQEKIKELTGSKLDPVRAFQIIKRESKDFSEQNEKALKADELLYELLKRDKLNGFGNKADSSERIRLKERERARELELLELELELKVAA